MASINITKGLAINLAGKPQPTLMDLGAPASVHVYPSEFPGIKPRLDVQEGDKVKKGAALFHSKIHPALKFRAPASGTVEAVILGARRSLQEIRIKPDGSGGEETFKSHAAEAITSLSREEILAQLQDTGLLACIIQRPFSKIADPAVTPKSIFVNGMNTGLFEPELNLAVLGHEAVFQAGLDALSVLTSGKVHLCIPGEAPSKPLSDVLINPRNAQVHKFTGAHPAGNTSVHIHHIDPIAPGQNVWTIKGQDVLLIGELLLSGKYPSSRVVSLGGPGVAPEACGHYRLPLGSNLDLLLKGKLENGEQRILSGHVFNGIPVGADSGLRFYAQAITVIPEGRERHFLGWMAPGANRFSQSRLYASRWMPRTAPWKLNTNLNGSKRAMVMTGLYDRYMPMNIMVDYLARAVLAGDTEEAVKLGLLETDPEDFAVCAFACPSKTDLVSIIRGGLAQVEKEGI